LMLRSENLRQSFVRVVVKRLRLGRRFLELPIGGGAMYVHDRDGGVSKFKANYKRMAYLVKEY
jgi:hypothetical protein